MPADARPLNLRIVEYPLDDDAGTGSRLLSRIAEKASQSGVPLGLSEELRLFLSGVFAGSTFLSGIAGQDPASLAEILRTPPEAYFQAILDRTSTAVHATHSMRDAMRALRRGKRDVALLTALADLGGVWTVDTVTEHLSEAASRFTTLAINFLLTRAAQSGTYTPNDPRNPSLGSGLIVLGMGKLGANELNYSSDIDLIVFFDRDRAALAAHVEPAAFFVRLTRDLVHVMQERTSDGYVYRTDLRLRPDPGSTQAAISTEAALHYYETRGQNWERAAMIKARPVGGDVGAGDALLSALGPYVWRKYLDYKAIADIHAMKRQIHAAKGHERIAVGGHNLKLGRGGIREIEFFVQSQQLIAGGRQPALRSRKTVTALERLAEHNWISAQARDDLTSAYRFLRRMEHRLQMVADEQTHTLPSNDEGLARFARFAGYSETDNFQRDLVIHMQNVESHYAALFEDVPELTPNRIRGNLVFTGDADDPATTETLTRIGFRNPSAAIATVKGWHYGRYPAMRSARAREILTVFTPALLEALGDTGDPDLALATFDSFLSGVPSALQLFSMLRANPQLLRLVAQIMGSAPRLARLLTRRRLLLDVVLDPGHFGGRATGAQLRQLIHDQTMEAPTYEDRLNRARVSGQEQSFSIGVRLLSRQISPVAAGEAYSELAGIVIETLLEAVQDEYGQGFPPPAIIAMGKLGGREMTAASDVDLIAVYDAPADRAAQSMQHYARLTQRLISAISAPTSEGTLYPVDMRLRPSGKSGAVAVRLDGFVSYQRTQAWTWEHLALTRARPVAGPDELCERLNAQVRVVLTTPRDRANTAAGVREMKALIEKEKPTADPWHTRNHKGGLVDVEFIAQFLQITHAADEPSILDQNTTEALRKLVDAGILHARDGATLIEAATLYQNVAHILRLCTEGRFVPDVAPRDLLSLLMFATGETVIDALERRLRDSYSVVAKLFGELVH